jgi:hypothetical protein
LLILISCPLTMSVNIGHDMLHQTNSGDGSTTVKLMLGLYGSKSGIMHDGVSTTRPMPINEFVSADSASLKSGRFGRTRLGLGGFQLPVQ